MTTCNVKSPSRNALFDTTKTRLQTEGNKLVDHGNGLYTLDGSLRFNFVASVTARFPCRMVIIKLKASGGGLLVWSPFSPTEEVMNEVYSLQESVRFVMAPNSMHWLGVVDFAAACHDRWPNQPAPLLCAAPGLPKKAEVVKYMQKACTKWDVVLPNQLPPDWPLEEIALHHIPGIPLIEEVVLYHKPSKTLVAAELAFNFQRDHPTMDVTWPINWYLRVVDGYRPCCLTRTFQYLLDDPEAAVEAVETILRDWDIQRLVPAHGVIVPQHEDPKDKLRKGTLDLLKEIRQKQQKARQYSSHYLYHWAAAVAVGVVACASVYLLQSQRTRRIQ